MKIVLVVLALVGGAASAASCYSIIDQDQKNYCLALERQQPQYCYSIRNVDQRNLCLAYVKRDKFYCYSIISADAKNACFALSSKIPNK